MIVLVCHAPHCNAEATESVNHPGVRWLLCADHADAERALAVAFSVVARDTRPNPGCRFPGCHRAHHGRGLCSRHYHRARRRGLLPISTTRREQARAALRSVPGTPPDLTATLADQPAWIRQLAASCCTDAWARVRQELHNIAGVPL